MTTITTAELRRSTPRRTRRYVIAALATAALLVPTMLVASRVNDNDARTYVAPKTNPVVDPSPAVNPTLATASMRLIVNEAATEACASSYAEACQFAQTWAPVGLDSLDAVTDACNGGYADACVVAAQIG
jgi:hypothetical protein